MANNIIQKKYKMGDVILRQGEDVLTMQIISQGRCRLAVGVAATKSIVSSTAIKGSGIPLKGFKTGLSKSLKIVTFSGLLKRRKSE